MANLPRETKERLEEDIERIDEIASLAAKILYELESAIFSEDFDPNRFKEEIENRFQLDETRKLLFERAVDVYKKAVDYTHQNETVIGDFLNKTKLNLDKYESISASFDKIRPGVIIIKIKSRADAVQLDNDIEDDSIKKLRNLGKTLGAEVNIVGHEKGSWAGKSISLKSLGIEEALPILGIIVIREDAKNGEGVMDHEYAHRQYEDVIKPFLHKYLSGWSRDAKGPGGSVDQINKLPAETKEKLVAALGEIKTKRHERLTQPKNTQIENQLSKKFAELGIPTMPQEEVLDSELWQTLRKEQDLLDEMRAYGFSHDITSPKTQITALKMEKPEYEGQLGYIDPKMAQRFLQLHLLVLKSFLTSLYCFYYTRCLLGVSQTLSQAIRLIEAEVDSSAGQFDSPERFKVFIHFVERLASGKIDHIFTYQIGEAVIPKDEVLKTLLPPREKFEEAVRIFEMSKEPELEEIRKLYQRLSI